MIHTFLLLVSLSFGVSPTLLHEFHISKAEILYNTSEQALQITMHIYIDDLEDALKNQGVEKIHLCTELEDEQAEVYLEKYLRQQFKLQVNGQTVEYNFLGKEPSEDLQAVWCYMEVENIQHVEELFVSNGVLQELFDDQKNIVQVNMDKQNKGYFLFTKDKYEAVVNF